MRPRLVPDPHAPLRCALCHGEDAAVALGACPGCRTRFHPDCRSAAPACPTLGCRAAARPPDPRVACSACWRLRPREVGACECGERALLRHEALVWPALRWLGAGWRRLTGRPGSSAATARGEELVRAGRD